MKKQSINKSLALLLSFWMFVGCVPLVAKADPVSDIYNVLKDISKTSSDMYDLQNTKGVPDLNDINKFSQEVSDLTGQQLTLSQEQWRDLQKAYQMSRELDNAVPTEMWTADDWNSALSDASGGNSSRYNELKAAYATQNPTITTTTANEPIDVDDLVENTYEQKSAVTNTALASSQYTYEDVNHRIDTFNQLKAMIDSDTPNEKASIDLMARILVEIGYIQTEMLRQQSVHTQLVATNAQEEINGQTGNKNFFSKTNQ